MTDAELIARLRKYKDDLLSITADRIEALTKERDREKAYAFQCAINLDTALEQLAAAQHDAKEAEAYAEEVERELRDTQDRANAFATKEYYTEMRAERAEAKLAKALEAMEDIKRYSSCGDTRRKAIETLAEIKGESHD